VAAVKGQNNGRAMEVLSASIQAGAQREIQVGLARAGVSSAQGSWEVRAIEAEAHTGTYNPDASIGYNAGAAVNAIAGEVTLGSQDNSLSFGLSAGVSAEVSVGVRDADADGIDEYCVRAGFDSFVGGACVEPESVQDAAAELYEDITSTVETWLE
jgi:hypothetical protein